MSDPTPATVGDEAPARRAAAAARAEGAPQSAGRPGALDRQSYGPALTRGYGETFGRGLELALTLAVMVGIGWLADRVFDTAPLFVIVFSVIGFAGITAKLWLGYDLEMRKHDEGAVWSREPAGTDRKAS